MGAYISRRLFAITVISISLFIAFTAFSFAQEVDTNNPQTIRPETEISTPQTVRPVQTTQVRESITERVNQRRIANEQQMEARQTAFMQRLENVSDVVKRSALERINEAIQTINENKTTRWANVLDLLSDILERIKVKIDDMETAGVDVTSINALVATAETAISDASTAVETQAEKIYVLEIDNEQTLRQTIQSVVTEFREDLRSTLELVKNARDAVREVARELALTANTNTAPTSNEENDTIN